MKGDLGDFVPYIDDEQVRVVARPDGTAMLWLPAVDYLDTIGGYSAEVAISREHAEELLHALGAWLAGPDDRVYEVVGDWGVDSADSEAQARGAAARWLAKYPHCGAVARRCVAIDFEDGGEYRGPWEDLEPDTKEEQP